MGLYKIVRKIRQKNLEEEVYKFSHYQSKNHFFRKFLKELKKSKYTQRNIGGSKYTHYFTAWISKGTLYMKHTWGWKWPPYTFPKRFYTQDTIETIE